MKHLIIAEIEKLLPEDSQDTIVSAMRYILFAPAKYIRPTLVIGSSHIFNVSIDIVLPISIAVEFIHSYSLVHDDLPCMDDSNTRRGQPSCHKKFGEAVAVLVGDSLLTLAFEILSSAKNERCCEIIKILSQAIGIQGMIKGQFLDIQHKKNKDTQIKYINLLKTARLFAASCEIGGIIGNASLEERKALHQYGTNLGLIFQAKDDTLDCEQNILVGDNNYINQLHKEALHYLNSLSGNTNYLHNLLNQIKNNDQ